MSIDPHLTITNITISQFIPKGSIASPKEQNEGGAHFLHRLLFIYRPVSLHPILVIRLSQQGFLLTGAWKGSIYAYAIEGC